MDTCMHKYVTCMHTQMNAQNKNHLILTTGSCLIHFTQITTQVDLLSQGRMHNHKQIHALACMHNKGHEHFNTSQG